MKQVNSGGPAFPEVRVRGGDNYNPPTKIYFGGMSLRDYFAAKILPTIYEDCTGGEQWKDFVAQEAYRMADAMLKAREN